MGKPGRRRRSGADGGEQSRVGGSVLGQADARDGVQLRAEARRQLRVKPPLVRRKRVPPLFHQADKAGEVDGERPRPDVAQALGAVGLGGRERGAATHLGGREVVLAERGEPASVVDRERDVRTSGVARDGVLVVGADDGRGPAVEAAEEVVEERAERLVRVPHQLGEEP